MKILYLTNNENARGLYEWLKERETDVRMYSERLNLSFVQEYGPDMVISYNYNYLIRKDVIDYMEGNILNLHISLLPWNRGFSPNLWSFLDGTPKGVSIHYIDEGLDTGAILLQEEMNFQEWEESFATTYEKLNHAIQELLKRNWKKLREGKIKAEPQVGKGSYHTMADLEQLRKQLPFSWNENIGGFMERYQQRNAGKFGGGKNIKRSIVYKKPLWNTPYFYRICHKNGSIAA